MGFAETELTQDQFLGGLLTLKQPRAGYRAGIDPVFLAAATPARAGESVLELGCGAGTASLCLARRVAGLGLVGVERQPDYAALARTNAAANAITMEVLDGDIAALPAALRERAFDHVILNPPYHLRGQSTLAEEPGREGGRFEDTPLALWLDVATRRLKPRGYLTLIQKAERLPDILARLDDRLGSLRIKPLASRAGADAVLVLVQARKGGRSPARLLAPLALHDGSAHDMDRDSYSAAARAVLRQGEALPID